jgi:hypothetical protein
MATPIYDRLKADWSEATTASRAIARAELKKEILALFGEIKKPTKQVTDLMKRVENV